MSLEIKDISLIPAEVFIGYMEEILALPLHKRAKWRASALDTNGVKRRVRFINNELVITNSSIWMPVHPCPKDPCHDLTFGNEKSREVHRRLTQAYQRGFDGFAEEHNRMMEEAATGNHRSKPRKFKVPTSAGEPVRG
jgi:hypothetical protein